MCVCLATLTNMYRVKTQCARTKSSGLGRRGWRGKARLKLKQDTLPSTNDGQRPDESEKRWHKALKISTKSSLIKTSHCPPKKEFKYVEKIYLRRTSAPWTGAKVRVAVGTLVFKRPLSHDHSPSPIASRNIFSSSFLFCIPLFYSPTVRHRTHSAAGSICHIMGVVVLQLPLSRARAHTFVFSEDFFFRKIYTIKLTFAFLKLLAWRCSVWQQ